MEHVIKWEDYKSIISNEHLLRRFKEQNIKGNLTIYDITDTSINVYYNYNMEGLLKNNLSIPICLYYNEYTKDLEIKVIYSLLKVQEIFLAQNLSEKAIEHIRYDIIEQIKENLK